MDSERKNSRRELLKAGAALAGGITLGTGGKAQAHDHPMTPGSENAYPMIHGSKEQIEYGQRSKYVTSVRVQHPIGGRPSPRTAGSRRDHPARKTSTSSMRRAFVGATTCGASSRKRKRSPGRRWPQSWDEHYLAERSERQYKSNGSPLMQRGRSCGSRVTRHR